MSFANALNASLTEAVSRLLRYGSDYSQLMEKNRQSIDALIVWLGETFGHRTVFPRGYVVHNCLGNPKQYPQGWCLSKLKNRKMGIGSGNRFCLGVGETHPVSAVFELSRDLATGWLDEIEFLLGGGVSPDKRKQIDSGCKLINQFLAQRLPMVYDTPAPAPENPVK